MKKLLFFDVGNTLVRAGFRDLSSLDDAMRIVLQRLAAVKQNLPEHTPILVFDGGLDQRRENALHFLRLPLPPRFDHMLLELQSVLAGVFERVGAATFHASGFEARDLMAIACAKPNAAVDRIVVSTDPWVSVAALSDAALTQTGASVCREDRAETPGMAKGMRAGAFWLLMQLQGRSLPEALDAIHQGAETPADYFKTHFQRGDDETFEAQLNLTYPCFGWQETDWAGVSSLRWISIANAETVLKRGLLRALSGPKLNHVEWEQSRTAHKIGWFDGAASVLGLSG